jgi:hypothetical protein
MTTLTVLTYPADYEPPRPPVTRSRVDVVEYWTRLNSQLDLGDIERDLDDVYRRAELSRTKGGAS